MFWGHDPGTGEIFCCVGENFVPAICCMKFNLLEFVRHEAGTKCLTFQCRIECAALAICPRYNIEVTQCLLRVYRLEKCPCNMRSIRTYKGAFPRLHPSDMHETYMHAYLMSCVSRVLITRVIHRSTLHSGVAGSIGQIIGNSAICR